MNEQRPLEDSPLTRPRRCAAMALASVAMLGVSMTACSSGDSGADAASAAGDTTASTSDISTDPGTATAAADGGPGRAPGGLSGLGGEVTAIDGSTITV